MKSMNRMQDKLASASMDKRRRAVRTGLGSLWFVRVRFSTSSTRSPTARLQFRAPQHLAALTALKFSLQEKVDFQR
jgi:hypothetical protein